MLFDRVGSALLLSPCQAAPIRAPAPRAATKSRSTAPFLSAAVSPALLIVGFRAGLCMLLSSLHPAGYLVASLWSKCLDVLAIDGHFACIKRMEGTTRLAVKNRSCT